MYELNDTIVAIATPAGMGGLGIVRLSGGDALAIARQLFVSSKSLHSKRQMLFGKFKNPQTGEVLDEGILLVMPKPHSYTAEDVVEFHAHGSPALLARLVELMIGLGARAAEPGEFTYRAFVNGRLDLAQAEAVEALVSAQGDTARRQALSQLTGGLSTHLEPIEEALKALYLKIEARLEFSEDGIPPLDLEKFRNELAGVHSEIEKLSQSYQQGKVIREGLTVALVGPPNVGKSSLLNALVGTHRAIVTPLAGTTRDVVEGEIRLKGVRVRFFDTAGIREAGNIVEVEGIHRSRRVIAEADIVFWLVDAFSPQESLQELKSTNLPRERTWFLFNKIDLVNIERPWRGSDLDPERCLGLSCQTGEGLTQLVGKIDNLIQTPIGGEDVILTSARHQQEIQKTLSALENLKTLMASGQPYELWAEDLREAALAVGRIRGRNLPATAFEDIFTKFCIGK